MECMKHKVAAVGVCKTCGRAVCRSCARDSGYAVTCSAECEMEAAKMHAMNAKAKNIYGLGDGKQPFPLAALIWGLFAALFGGLGIFQTISTGQADWVLLMFGGVFLCVAIVTYRRAKSLGINC